jgi:hypothetical protein
MMATTVRISIGFVLGILAATGYVAWKASQAPEAVTGEVLPEIQQQVATPEIRKVYVYLDAKKPKGTPAGTKVLTAVKTDTGTATTLLDVAGYSSIVLQTDPLPWFRPENVWSGSLYAGVYDKDFTARLTVERSAVQIKRAHIGAVFAVDAGPGETRLFIGIGGRF